MNKSKISNGAHGDEHKTWGEEESKLIDLMRCNYVWMKSVSRRPSWKLHSVMVQRFGSHTLWIFKGNRIISTIKDFLLPGLLSATINNEFLYIARSVRGHSTDAFQYQATQTYYCSFDHCALYHTI